MLQVLNSVSRVLNFEFLYFTVVPGNHAMKSTIFITLLAAAICVDAQYYTSHSYANPTEVSFPGYCYSFAPTNCLNWNQLSTNQGPYFTGTQAGTNGATTPPAGGTWASIAAANNYVFHPSNCASFCGAQGYYNKALGIRADNAC
jgi:hypothetical protein